jgi:hypothetical protein
VLGLCPAHDAPALAQVLKRAEDVFTDARDFDRALRRAACTRMVVVLPRLADPPGIEWLRSFRRRHMLRALILVTRRDPDNIAQLTGLTVDSLVWYRHYEAELPQALRQLPGRLGRLRAADALSRLRRLSADMRSALLATLQVEAPFRSVAEWAGALHTGASTLRDEFLAEFGTHGLTPKTWLDGLWLVDVLESSPRPEDWEDLVRATGRDRRTLQRIVIHVMGSNCKPRDLTSVRLAARLVLHIREALYKRGRG